MDGERRSQWLRGVLDLTVLALLREGEAYGYELAQALDDRGLGQIQGGTLYPVLLRMERLDLVTSAWRTSHTGPARKYYRLTDHGVSTLERGAADWSVFVRRVSGILGEVMSL